MSEPSELSLDLLTNSPRTLINAINETLSRPQEPPCAPPFVTRALGSETAHRAVATSATF